MPDLTHGTRVLLHALSGLPAGTIVSADTLRDEFDAAQLTVAERGGAFQSALYHGYIRRAGWHPSSHPGRKGGSMHTWARTRKPIPEHVCRVEVPA